VGGFGLSVGVGGLRSPRVAGEPDRVKETESRMV